MAKPRTIGNMIAPPRFLAFVGVLVAGVSAARALVDNWPLAIMAGFDVSALVFLLSCMPLLRTREARIIKDHAAQNDANRHWLLAITAIVMAVLLVAIAAEAVGRNPQPLTKLLIIATLVLAWLFSNTVYALHYAHLVYMRPKAGCVGLEFPETSHPVYWDFVYFAFTLGMTFQTSDVTVGNGRIRKVVTIHCLAAFVFNIGVLAFTINVLGSGG